MVMVRHSSIWQALRKLGAGSMVVGLLLVGNLAQAKGPVDATGSLGSVALLVLPEPPQKLKRLPHIWAEIKAYEWALTAANSAE